MKNFQQCYCRGRQQLSNSGTDAFGTFIQRQCGNLTVRFMQPQCHNAVFMSRQCVTRLCACSNALVHKPFSQMEMMLFVFVFVFFCRFWRIITWHACGSSYLRKWNWKYVFRLLIKACACVICARAVVCVKSRSALFGIGHLQLLEV